MPGVAREQRQRLDLLAPARARRRPRPSAAWSRLVSTVTPTISGRATPSGARLARRRPRPRRASWPRRPTCGSSASTTPSRVAARTAPRTWCGMSWNFRSRKTRWPRAAERADDRGPFGGEQRAADLQAADDAVERGGQAVGAGRRCRRRARRGAGPCGFGCGRRRGVGFAPISTAADEIGDARDAVALEVVGDAVEQLRPDERDRRSWRCRPGPRSRRRSGTRARRRRS